MANAEYYTAAWSTKFTALMQTNGLFKSLFGQEITPEEIAPLTSEATADQFNKWPDKVEDETMKLKQSTSEITAFGVILC